DTSTWRERLSHTKPGEGRSGVRLVLFLIITLLAGAALKFLPPEGGGRRSRMEEPTIVDARGVGTKMIPNENWKAECASACHGAFHPTLLPAASWKRIVAGLEDHFGDDASLDDETTGEILAFLLSASAERSRTEASRKILRSIRKGDIPARITDTPYWIRKHREIGDDVYQREEVVSKSNCVACHPGAEVGSFEDEDIHIPEPKRGGEKVQ
ncbi:MAG: diheme cytochrome c, partial [Thermodesulfobacteriota bacterium]